MLFFQLSFTICPGSSLLTILLLPGPSQDLGQDLARAEPVTAFRFATNSLKPRHWIASTPHPRVLHPQTQPATDGGVNSICTGHRQPSFSRHSCLNNSDYLHGLWYYKSSKVTQCTLEDVCRLYTAISFIWDWPSKVFGSAGDFGVNCPLYCAVECLAAVVRWVVGAPPGHSLAVSTQCRRVTQKLLSQAAMACVKWRFQHFPDHKGKWIPHLFYLRPLSFVVTMRSAAVCAAEGGNHLLLFPVSWQKQKGKR